MADDNATRSRRKRAHEAGEHYRCAPDCGAVPVALPLTVDGDRALTIREEWPDAPAPLLTEACAVADMIDDLGALLELSPASLPIRAAIAAQRRLLVGLFRDLGERAAAPRVTLPGAPPDVLDELRERRIRDLGA